MKHILRCPLCCTYTLKEMHNCGTRSILPVPAKWSPEDKYGRYRREARREELKRNGFV